MASLPGSSKWALSNWTQGPVTLFQALGISKGTVQLPTLQASLTEASIQSGSSTSSSSADTSGGNTNTPASGSVTSWSTALLNALGAPVTQANLSSLASWIAHEQTGGTLGSNNNPLDTSQPATGATSINSDGVKKYTTAAQGIAATVATILQYPQILAALKSGNGLCGNGLASSFEKWSSNSYSSVC